MEKGLRLACIYSWNCEAAKMLKVPEILCGFAINQDQKSVNLVKKILKRMGPHKDYCFIANTLGLKNIFDPEVIRAYWRCWHLSKRATQWHNHAILSQLKNIPFDLLNAKKINDCFVFSGKIVEEKDDGWIVSYRRIIKTKKRLCFGPLSLRRITKVFTARAKKGAIISFHFSVDAEILSNEESRQLAEATNEVLEKFNATPT